MIESFEFPKEHKKQIKNPEVEELFYPIKKILEELRTKIEKGEYRYIVGDDASGRIPALIFYNFIKKISIDNNLPIPKLYFLAGSRGFSDHSDSGKEKIEKLEEYVTPVLGNKNSFLDNFKNKFSDSQKRERILIVTDTIVTGKSLKPLTTVLQNRGLQFDLASIGYREIEEKLTREKYLGGEIFFGQNRTPNIYLARARGIHGVKKYPENVLSESTVDSRDADLIKSSREDVKTLTDDLYAWYKNPKT